MNALPIVWLALALAGPGPKDSPKTDPPAIGGDWAFVSATLDGAPLRLPAIAQTISFAADGTVEGRAGAAGPTRTGRYTLDPKKAPAEIDLSDRTCRAWPGWGSTSWTPTG